MNRVVLIIVIIINFFSSYSQTGVTILNESSNTSGIEIYGDTIFASSQFDGTVYYKDYIQGTTAQSIQIGNQVRGLDIYNSSLYVSHSADGIFKYDLSQQNTITQSTFYCYIEGTPNGICVDNDTLYAIYGTKIFRITDINSTQPTIVQIIDNLNLSSFGTIGICKVGKYLYVSTHIPGLVRYDLSSGEPLGYNSEVIDSNSYNGIAKYDENTIIALGNQYMDSVYSININSGNVNVLFPTEITTPYDIVKANNKIFVSNIEGGEVNMYDLITSTLHKDIT